MNSERIEDILSKNGIAQSKELSLALKEILETYSRDRNLAKNVAENISRQERQERRAKEIR